VAHNGRHGCPSDRGTLHSDDRRHALRGGAGAELLYAELFTGGDHGLSCNAMNVIDSRSELGARFDDLKTVNGMPLRLRRLRPVAHDWVSKPALTATFPAGALLPGGA
jgi:hypothetical protein